MMNDLIADALTRIRNAAMRRLEVATLLHSNTVVGVMNVLLQKEYIAGFKVIDGQNNKKTIQVELKYDDKEKSAINEIVRVSKPGRRVYKPASEIKNFKNGYGTIILSTNKGIIANDEAFAANVGGEVLCTVW
ncbi:MULTISPECIES: 30S ribosomal protein S8 [Aliarcobacter]|uniref:Small ribosomal subunit protein uS8 n=7 Tax=Arcobacteraceae TaxID=2808963 RepID=A0AAU0P1Z2_9BACT|nr:30S ribosomal protein S8 [Aliarcobacter cryaerophilus]OQA75832.1 MAG: 30S ribosomal protein S8 [Candidatus Dependentiae bacterium ADurb.Bin246]WNL11698.1 30S ribosomal protein S8 [Arcobacter sp. AZ-2023]WPD03171.1 30S ribosomal protein S8 [Arcobacter sp. DSM 115972]WPD05316.1 30S ribosomal protein S8 [Arcobacter sp. DSM 115956]WPD07410.1 30S ribosomal protein S8 [Arcobacter sp. DSM 115955]WPD10311.1 30S ribosomal protein S8 [Arcobacter sp. DSM 115954]WPD12402.1 30S ribosomal protein S8 [A